MGIVLSFKYAGGSNPGATRIVYDKDKTVLPRVGLVEGIDLETGSFRKFDTRKMRDVQHVTAVQVNLNHLPNSYTGYAIQSEYAKEGKLAHFDEQANVVIVVDKPKPSGTAIKFSNTQGDNPSFYIDGKVGVVRLTAGPGGTVMLTRDGAKKQTDAETLLTHLKQVLGG